MARREYVDKREWPEYNEKLVRRGELYFSFEFLDRWKEDLAQINGGKVGRRFLFPEPFIQNLMMLHTIFGSSLSRVDVTRGRTPLGCQPSHLN
jgi:hypothetical protein